IGSIGGLVLALWISDLLVAFQPPNTSNMITLDSVLDRRVLGFTFLLSLLTAILFGLAPALHITKPNMVSALKDEVTLFGLRARGWNLRHLLVVVQVALSLVVLIGAGLCVRSLHELQAIDAGFEPAKVLVMSLDLKLNGYDEARGRQFYPQLV